MTHELRDLPKGHPFEEARFQCWKCGCTFSEDNPIVEFMLNCELEQTLREEDPNLEKEIPILVKQ